MIVLELGISSSFALYLQDLAAAMAILLHIYTYILTCW